MKIAILSTGHEIVAGEVLNTNAKQIAYDLSSHGLEVVTHLSCRDIEDEMLAALDYLSVYDMIITIGGLGPTCDDITRFAVAKYLKLKLTEHPKAYEHLVEYQQKVSTLKIENRKQETLFPHDAILLDNPNGTAMGAWINHQKQVLVMLPGPPRECLPMWENYVLPVILEQYPSGQNWLRWLCFGIPEAALITDLDALLQNHPHELGYRAFLPYVEVKVKADEPHRSQIEGLLNTYFKDKQLLGNEIASHALKKFLLEKNVQLSIRDHLTGGFLEAALMEPRLYSKLSFHQEHPLHFNLSGLHDFWHQIEPMSHVACFFQIGEVLQKYEPSSRSQNLPKYAMEWAAFSLLKYLENQ